MSTILKTLTVTFVAAGLLAVGVGPSTASTDGGPGGGGNTVKATAFLTGLTNKLDAMLDELPNAGVARPS